MFSHIDSKNQPTMVDVSDKSATTRQAHATARVKLPSVVTDAMHDGDIHTAKGPVFQTAIVAGTMAAKRTHELIPFCHPLGLESCKIRIRLDDGGDAVIDCETTVYHKTGVEMEALTGVSVAALTVYDMCKGLSHDIVVTDVRLVSKTGGKSDYKAPSVADISGTANE
jgi:cyclic pyranopterin phosphate synthase